MSAHTTPISAHPTSSTASPYGNIIASLIFLLNLLTAFSLTSICWLVLIIRWILGSLFAIVRTFLPNEDGDKAPQPPVSFARVEKAHVFTKTAVASWAADKHQPSAPTYPVRYHQAPIHAPSSRFAPLTSSIMPPHRASPTPRTVDADKTRRGPVVPSARSGTSAARALGEVELRPRREARQLRMVKMASEARVEGEAQVKEEATQEHARQVPVAVNDPIGAHDVDLVPVAIYASPRVELAPSSPVLQSSAATDAQADVSTVTRHNPALFPVHEETSAPLAPCFHVVPYSTVVDDMECDERPPAPEPMSISVDDVAMSVDYPSPSEEYMDEMLSLPGVMITSCEDDELVGSLRACSLSCLSPMLPPMDVEPDAPVAEVTFSLSKCSLSDTYVLSEMDVDEDDMVVCCDDLDPACPSSAPLAMDVDVDAEEDTSIICDDDCDSFTPTAPSSTHGALPSSGSRSRLVKRHTRQYARVEIPSDFSAAPTPKPNLLLLRLVEKYADLGLDKPGVVFRVKLDVGVRKVERDSRSA